MPRVEQLLQGHFKGIKIFPDVVHMLYFLKMRVGERGFRLQKPVLALQFQVDEQGTLKFRGLQTGAVLDFDTDKACVLEIAPGKAAPLERDIGNDAVGTIRQAEVAVLKRRGIEAGTAQPGAAHVAMPESCVGGQHGIRNAVVKADRGELRAGELCAG